MRYTIFLLLLLFNLFSCKKAPVKPVYKLNDERLAHLIYDVEVGDAALSGMTASKQDSLKRLVWSKITALYGMSEAEVRNEIHTLERDPEKMKAIFDRVKEMSDSLR